MKNIYPILHSTTLFSGISEDEIAAMLNCLSSIERHFEKGETIFRVGDVIDSLGIVLSGSVTVIHEDFWGNRDILTKALPGQLFAEVYACSSAPLAVSVITSEPTDIIFLNVKKILTTCPTACAHHVKLIRNLLSALAGRNLLINRKLIQVSRRTTKDKLLAYLSAVSAEKGSSDFDIPFNRQELADYLSVDRSAMSAELSRMRDAGLLSFNRNHFTLK